MTNIVLRQRNIVCNKKYPMQKHIILYNYYIYFFLIARRKEGIQLKKWTV